MPEIMEVYVRPEYRGRGVARNADLRAGILRKIWPDAYCPQLELLTGSDNTAAQKFYFRHRLRVRDGEMHMSKQVK